MRENKLAELSLDLAVKGVELTGEIEGHYALKKCYETEFWLKVFARSKLSTPERIKGILHDCGEIRRMLVASVNTVKNKQ